MKMKKMIGIDLPKLQTFQLSNGALCGIRTDNSCSLTMRSMNEVMRND